MFNNQPCTAPGPVSMTQVAQKKMDQMYPDDLASLMRDSILTQSQVLSDCAQPVSQSCLSALQLLAHSTQLLPVIGVGKSGHIARKIASTFSSLGRAAVFIHAAEASHGDLGLMETGGVALILSNSGETTELSDVLYYCREHAIKIVAITASATSTLGKSADVVIAYGSVPEVCLDGLVPTTSTTISLVIGDALAVGMTQLRGTAVEDFSRYHPGGRLGLSIAKVHELMRTGDQLPIVSPQTPMSEVLLVISEKCLGVALVIDADQQVIGIITDGDMRRNIDRLWQSCAADICSRDVINISPDQRVSEVAKIMSTHGITACVVLDEAKHLLGLLHVHDYLRLAS